MNRGFQTRGNLFFLPSKSFFWTPLLIWDIQPAWRQQTFQLDAIFCVLFPLLNFVFLEVPAHRNHCGVLANFTMLLCKFQLDINIIFFSETRMPSPTSALLRILFVCGGRVFCLPVGQDHPIDSDPWTHCCDPTKGCVCVVCCCQGF